MNQTFGLSDDFKSSLRLFVYYYANNTLHFVINDSSILDGINYAEKLIDYPSSIEQAFSIFANNIKMDEDGNVLNHTHAMTRAAQWIRVACDDSEVPYKVEPEFEDWELELH